MGLSFIGGQYIAVSVVLANTTISEAANLAGFAAMVKRTDCMELPTRANELKAYLDDQANILELKSSAIDELSFFDAIPPSSIHVLLEKRSPIVSIQNIREKIRLIGNC